MIKITLPEPPSANRYWRKFRNTMVVSAEAVSYKSEVGYRCNQLGIESPTDLPVSVTLHWYRKIKSGDLDNRIKVALDAIKGYLFVDDRQVIAIHAYRYDDKQNPRLEVEVSYSE